VAYWPGGYFRQKEEDCSLLTVTLNLVQGPSCNRDQRVKEEATVRPAVAFHGNGSIGLMNSPPNKFRVTGLEGDSFLSYLGLHPIRVDGQSGRSLRRYIHLEEKKYVQPYDGRQ